MQVVTIHLNPEFSVDSWGNGWGYNIKFGSADNPPMRNLWFQDDDARILREEFDAMERAYPDRDTSAVWMDVLDPYL